MVEIRFWNEIIALLAIEVWFIFTSFADELKFFRHRLALGNIVRLVLFFLGGVFLIWYLAAPVVGFAFAFLFIGVLGREWDYWWPVYRQRINHHPR